MKEYVYPAIVYKNSEEEGVTITVPDVGIVTGGVTVEEAYLRAKDYLKCFFEVVTKHDWEIQEPSKFKEVYNNHKKEIVLLIDHEVD